MIEGGGNFSWAKCANTRLIHLEKFSPENLSKTNLSFVKILLEGASQHVNAKYVSHVVQAPVIITTNFPYCKKCICAEWSGFSDPVTYYDVLLILSSLG